jgi:hydroxypyruvate isomerase
LAVENLVWAANQVEAIGGVVLLEAVSGAPRYPLLTGVDVVRRIHRVRVAGGPDVRMLADLYHLGVNDDDVMAVIGEHGSLVGHVQVADAPGRHRPGTGQLALTKQLELIASRGYRGYIALEYIPRGTTAADLAELDLHIFID